MHVELLLADRRCYTYEAYAATRVSHSFEQAHIAHRRVYLSDGGLQDYLFHIHDSPPDWTLSFVNLTPHQKPLCDVLRIPHFLWLEGSLAPAIHFVDSTYGKVGICQKLSAKNFVFLPHGVEEQTPCGQKVFDVVSFADLLDLTFLEKTWRELFSSETIAKVQKAIEKGDPLAAGSHFFYAEQYLNAKKNSQAVASFKEVPLDVFGEHAGANWLLRLPPTVHLHTQLPFIEHFEVLKMSKIALLEPSSPWYLPALAAGCLPLPVDESLVKHYLASPAEREKYLAKLKPQLLEWSWEKQTKQLVEVMR